MEQQLSPAFPPRVMMVWTDNERRFVKENTEGMPNAMEYLSLLEHKAINNSNLHRFKVTDRLRVRQMDVFKEKLLEAQAKIASLEKVIAGLEEENAVPKV